MLDKGQTMYNWIRDLFPINRSITGDGVRETLFYLKKIVPIKIKSVPTGYKAYDWTVPNEWKVKEAFIKDDQNKTIIDFKNNNLHLVSYSTAINKTLTFLNIQNFKMVENNLYNLSKRLISVSPEKVLMRGYAIIKNNNDEVLTDSVSAQKYKNIKIQFKDSEIPVSTVQKKVKHEDKRQKSLL